MKSQEHRCDREGFWAKGKDAGQRQRGTELRAAERGAILEESGQEEA